jgi:hypothetical protein
VSRGITNRRSGRCKDRGGIRRPRVNGSVSARAAARVVQPAERCRCRRERLAHRVLFFVAVGLLGPGLPPDGGISSAQFAAPCDPSRKGNSQELPARCGLIVRGVADLRTERSSACTLRSRGLPYSRCARTPSPRNRDRAILSASRQRIAYSRSAFDRHLPTPLFVCGNRQWPPGYYSTKVRRHTPIGPAAAGSLRPGVVCLTR